MYLIAARFRAAKGKRDAGKMGTVFFRITGQADGDGKRPDRIVSSGIHAIDSSVLTTERATIIARLRLLYCIIERRDVTNESFNIDDVVEDFRKALSEDESMAVAIAKSKTDFPFRSDIVSVGREFKSDFKFVFPERTDSGAASLYDYIFNLSQSLKSEKRMSQAKNLLSLLANIKLFANGEDICFHEINQKFVHRYADWLKHTGISGSTQSFYLRNFRTVLNRAHDDGVIGPTAGWFKGVNTRIEHSYKISDGKLLRELVQKIEALNLSADSRAELVRDMFMFGFYCGGLELIDVANLEQCNVTGAMLSYRRRLKGLERKVVLGEQALKIIERYKSASDKYVFPLLSMSETALFASIRKYVNQSLKVIGRAVNYPNLSFNTNIAAYQSIASEVNIPELLLKRK